MEDVKNLGEAVGEAAGDNCDWHDNADYENSLRTLEMASRIASEIRDALSIAEVITVIEQSTRVAIGNTVEIEFDDETKREMTIGAWGESKPEQGLISYQSPLAKSLIGKTEGDDGSLKISGKLKDFTINKIYPPSYKYEQLIRVLLEKD